MGLLKKNYEKFGSIEKIKTSIKLLALGSVLMVIGGITYGCSPEAEAGCAIHGMEYCMETCLTDPSLCIDEDLQNGTTEGNEKVSDSTAAVAKLSARVETNK